ncbi:MAG TPA: CHAD domain-containing protein [Terrimicrobiaceae bacterium]
MGFHLEKDEPVGAGFQRILMEQTARLSEDLASADKDLEEAIHEVRRRCKRIRAVTRLLRPRAKALYRRENPAFRDIARGLSPFRDAHVRLETFDELLSHADEAERFAPLRDHMLWVDNRGGKELEKQLSLATTEVKAAQARLREAKIGDGAAFQLIEPGLRRNYKRGRRAMSRAYDRPEATAFHEWRKRVKDLGYQLQILRDLWSPLLKRLRSEVNKLGDLLGKEHDLTVLRSTVLKQADSGISKGDLRAFLALVEERKFELQAQAKTIGRRIYAEKSKDFTRRIFVYWETWQAEVPAPEGAENETLIPH